MFFSGVFEGSSSDVGFKTWVSMCTSVVPAGGTWVVLAVGTSAVPVVRGTYPFSGTSVVPVGWYVGRTAGTWDVPACSGLRVRPVRLAAAVFRRFFASVSARRSSRPSQSMSASLSAKAQYRPRAFSPTQRRMRYCSRPCNAATIAGRLRPQPRDPRAPRSKAVRLSCAMRLARVSVQP